MNKQNSYNKIMEKVEVSDEMRVRILNNIANNENLKNRKILSLSRWKRIASAAACIALLIVGSIVVQNILSVNHTNPNIDIDVEGPSADVIECNSASELSQKAGFEVYDINYIPFNVSSSEYSWCWNEFAQIDYSGNDNVLTYRKVVGNQDISGDYREYSVILNKSINGDNITIKGNEDEYSLAIWQSEEYSYSIYLNQGVDLNSIIKVIQYSDF
ncbi:hypothetical protein [Ruminococcus sp.]|uniref:hypothetical protein n=1 Tax=Ruminococcus sp. TaxID=41978 RepID=UPI0038679FE8